MFEKVNPMHPDKVADRLAGAIVDYAYTQDNSPKIAVEVLMGHCICNVICESSVDIPYDFVQNACDRISKESLEVFLTVVPQDKNLAQNQSGLIRCGDNGIFKGMPVTNEQKALVGIAKSIYDWYPCDGKYVLDIGQDKLIVCQSHMAGCLLHYNELISNIIVNPIGEWTGGLRVDSGATNRKLGSDMGDSVTGGGLHGKDLSKADVSINIYAWLKAQETGKPVELCCAIGDRFVDGKPYSEIVGIARNYINSIGGFEKFAEWGLIR